MAEEELGAFVCNLIVPDQPANFVIKTADGLWHFDREQNYAESVEHINNGMCAFTYIMWRKVDTSGGRSAAIEVAISEMLALSLGASFLTGMTAVPTRDLPMSAVKFLDLGGHFPRPRNMGTGWQYTSSLDEFIRLLEQFVRVYPSLEKAENARLLVHHWIDALAHWSLEDLTLSTSTVLEIIAATAARLAVTQGTPLKTFAERMVFAANRYSLPPLPIDFRDMRNDLVHEGTLSGKKFPNKDNIQCARAISEALDWIDQYFRAAFDFGHRHHARFGAYAFSSVNTFSLE